MEHIKILMIYAEFMSCPKLQKYFLTHVHLGFRCILMPEHGQNMTATEWNKTVVCDRNL